MREDIATYIRLRLWKSRPSCMFWEPGYHTPSWAPVLSMIGFRTPSQEFTPPLSAIKRALQASNEIVLIIRFSEDQKQIHTVGRCMGLVRDTDPVDGYFTTDNGYSGYRDPKYKETGPEMALLVGLFGINAPFILRLNDGASDTSISKRTRDTDGDTTLPKTQTQKHIERRLWTTNSLKCLRLCEGYGCSPEPRQVRSTCELRCL
jgi:hypothetical protein